MTTPDALSVTLEKYEAQDRALEGEPRSWLRYALLSAAEADAMARANELRAMAIEEEPDCLRGPASKPWEERAAFYRDIAATYRRQAESSRALAAEERATRGEM